MRLLLTVTRRHSRLHHVREVTKMMILAVRSIAAAIDLTGGRANERWRSPSSPLLLCAVPPSFEGVSLRCLGRPTRTSFQVPLTLRGCVIESHRDVSRACTRASIASNRIALFAKEQAERMVPRFDVFSRLSAHQYRCGRIASARVYQNRGAIRYRSRCVTAPFGVAPGGERVLHYLQRSSALFACYLSANMDDRRDKWRGFRGYGDKDGRAQTLIFSPLLYQLSYLGNVMRGNDLQRFWSRSANRRVQSWYVVPFSNIKVG